MQTIKGFIASKQRELDAHPVLDELRRFEPGVLERLVPQLIFPVMVLPDVIRKAEELVTEPALKRVARDLRTRALGRDRRFLWELSRLGIPLPSVPSLFDRTHEVARLASYALLAEAHRAPNDACRVVLLLTIESAVRALYLVEEERAMSVLEEQADACLSSLSLPALVRQQAIALIDRCYQTISAIFEGVEQSLAASPAPLLATARARTIDLAPLAMPASH
jgi:hypothetical protein